MTFLQRIDLQSPSGPTRILGDISPSKFVDLTLPVYKAMFAHMPTTAMLSSGRLRQAMAGTVQSMAIPKYYTSVSFGRLLALAGRRLRLKTAHFRAALHAITNGSGLILATNLMQEQVSSAYFPMTNMGDSPTSDVTFRAVMGKTLISVLYQPTTAYYIIPCTGQFHLVPS